MAILICEQEMLYITQIIRNHNYTRMKQYNMNVVDQRSLKPKTQTAREEPQRPKAFLFPNPILQ